MTKYVKVQNCPKLGRFTVSIFEIRKKYYITPPYHAASVVDPKTLNLDPDPGFWPNLDPDLDPGLNYQF